MGGSNGTGGGIEGGGMGDGGTDMAGAMMGAASGMDNGAITVGLDGNLYILSRVFPAGNTQATGSGLRTRLSALDGGRGSTLWSMVLEENWLTRPVQGPDGRLFLVGFSDQFMGTTGTGMGMFEGNSAQGQQGQNAKLYIVDAAAGRVINGITLNGEVASIPVVAGAGTGYTIFVVAFDSGYSVDSRRQVQGMRREATLYAFDRDGTVKFTKALD